MDFSNLKNLSNSAMIGATEGWVDPNKERPVLEKIPEVAGYLGRLDGARGGLIDCQVSQDKTETDKKLKEMSEKAAGLDSRHDTLARGIHAVLEGNALLASDDQADKITNLRTRLFPEGMSAVNRTYLEEAGEIEMAKGRLGDDSRELLAAIPFMGGNLQAAVDDWFATGVALGNLERDRTQMAEAAQSAEGVTRSDVVDARNQWIRVVRAIIAGLELAEGVEETTMATILQPLKSATEKAGSKSSSKEQPAPEQA
jgi:hypothetical protein